MPDHSLRILIAAEHASARFGGEAIPPVSFFRNLRARSVETWMVVHERTRSELHGLLPDDIDRVYFVPDTWLHKAMNKLARFLPTQIADFTVCYISRLSSQLAARKIARRLIPEKGIT